MQKFPKKKAPDHPGEAEVKLSVKREQARPGENLPAELPAADENLPAVDDPDLQADQQKVVEEESQLLNPQAGEAEEAGVKAVN